MPDVPVSIRIPAEWRAQIESICAVQGVTLSEYFRSALLLQMNSGVSGIDEGYMAGRMIGLQIAHRALALAGTQLPETYEEALAFLNADGAT